MPGADDLDELRGLLDALEPGAALLDDARFAERAAALGELEFALLAASGGAVGRAEARGLVARAEALQRELAAANRRLFERLRAALIAPGATPAERRRLLLPFVAGDAPAAAGGERPYDHLDLLLDGVLGLEAPEEQGELADPELVGYQPTPARVIFELVERAEIGADDLLFDLGSGLGQVAIVAAMLTGCAAMGVEIDPALCEAARRGATSLGLAGVSFRCEDVRAADLSAGTVFYLYTPFTGAVLHDVLGRLHAQAGRRPIRVCAYGPYLAPLAEQPWLRLVSPAGSGSVTIFESRDSHD
jgi:hypothetical protein